MGDGTSGAGGADSFAFRIGGSDAAIDAPAQPARAAVTLSISPTPGNVCNHTSPQLSMPSAQNTSVFGELLGCNLMDGCKPDEFVVYDGDRGTSIYCSVTQDGDNRGISTRLDVPGSPSMQFQASGFISPSGGGMLAVMESNSEAMGGGSDPACSVQLPPNTSFLERGKIWAQFECPEFRDPNDLSETGCTVKGAFLFENCSE